MWGVAHPAKSRVSFPLVSFCFPLSPYCPLNTLFRIFPTGLLGNSLTNSTVAGALYTAICARQYAMISSLVVVAPSFNTIAAFTASPFTASYGMRDTGYGMRDEATQVCIAHRASRIAYRVSRIAYRVSRIAYRASRIPYRASRTSTPSARSLRTRDARSVPSNAAKFLAAWSRRRRSHNESRRDRTGSSPC